MPDNRELRPYPGLRRFEQFEAQIFFGRETHTDRLLEILQRERFLAVIGPSGSGKSSLVSAGMLPAIAAGWLGTVGRWRLALLRPGDRPIRNLARALLDPAALGAELSAAADDDRDIAARLLSLVQADLQRGPLALRHLVAGAHRRSAEPLNLLVLVDQFEEIFRFTDRGAAQADEADAFVDLLLHARAGAPAPISPDDQPQIFVALTMRTDFLGHCVRFADLPEAINRAQYLTPRLSRAQLETAIAAPARVCGGDVQPEVVNELINAVSTDFDQLPILQHALARMWEEARRSTPESPEITRTELEQVGGVEGALDRHAEQVFGELSQDQQALAEHLFRTITGRSLPDSGSRDTRRPQSLRQIAHAAALESWEQFVPVVEAFAREGVNFLTCGLPLDADTRIDITHEALIRQWQRLRQWVAEEADRAAEYRRWRDRVGVEPLTGADLARALEWEAGSAAWHPTAAWAARYATSGDPAEEFERTQEYIARSRTVDEQRRKAEERRRQLVVVVLFMLVIVGLISAVTFFQQKQAAERLLAESRFREAVNRIQRNQRSQALGYLADAMKHDSDYLSARLLTASLLLDRTWPLPLVKPMRHSDRVHSVAFSPDGTRLLTASADHTAQLWEVRSGAPLGAPMLHEKWVRTAVFSPDGGRILTTSDDGTARLWNAQSGEAWPGAHPMPHRKVYSAAFSPDGSRIVTASLDGTALLWDATMGTPWPDAQPMSHAKAIYSAMFSPDGTRIVTASMDKTAKLWDGRSGAPLPDAEPMKHENGVYSAVFSPDGRRIVTASWDGAAGLWDGYTGIPWSTKPMKHDGPVNSAVFSPDGTRVVTAANDGTARLWDGYTGMRWTADLMHHDSPVNAAIFSPDGTRIATASNDGTGRLWDALDGHALTEPMPHRESVSSVAFNFDGTRLATGSYDKTARLWDARPGSAAAEPRRIAGVQSAAFSPVDTDPRILTVSHDGAQVWVNGSPTPVTKPLERREAMLSAAFSPDASRVLTVSTNSVSLWDGGAEPHQLAHDGRGGILFAAFSPDGSLIVTVSSQAVQLWDAFSAAQVSRLTRERAPSIAESEAPTNCTVCADISPGGDRVVTVDGSVAVLWDTRSGEPLPHAKPMVHKDSIRSVAFSPDGTRIVTASEDGTARLWDGFSGKPLKGIKPLLHTQAVYAAVFSPNGKRIVTGSKDNTARLWDARSGSPLGEPMRHGNAVNAVSFSRKGTEVLTGSFDNTARLWDATSGAPLAEPIVHGSQVITAVFSPDGTRILTASADDRIRISTLPITMPQDQPELARMAQTIGGITIDERSGAVSRSTEQQLEEAQFTSQPSGSPQFNTLMEWFLADRGRRAISPFSTMTSDEYRHVARE